VGEGSQWLNGVLNVYPSRQSGVAIANQQLAERITEQIADMMVFCHEGSETHSGAANVLVHRFFKADAHEIPVCP
jgi:hypothetical protein